MAVATPKAVLHYQRTDETFPFREWVATLKDAKVKAAIANRIDRVSLGSTGHTNDVGSGVQELKIDLGPGYRVYFGNDGKQIVILLCGGDKSTQTADIQKAKAFWADYKARK